MTNKAKKAKKAKNAKNANYALKTLVSACRFCPFPDCKCNTNLNEMRGDMNRYLDPSHQIGKETLKAMCRAFDQDPGYGSPTIGPGGEKQRDDDQFDRLVEEAFKAFRDKERDLLLNVPAGPLRHDNTKTDKWWAAGAHLRHHVELLLVLRGLKPCVLFCKDRLEHTPTFSAVVADCLVPVMDRLGLWAYGFRLGFQCRSWVLYDERSALLPQVRKIFLTDRVVKELDGTGAYSTEDEAHFEFLVPNIDVARALGYPIRADSFRGGPWVNFRDETEMEVLVSMGRPQPLCCVTAMGFGCPVGGPADWVDMLVYFNKCEQAAKSVGTKLWFHISHNEKMEAWLEYNPGLLVGPGPWVGGSGPSLHKLSKHLEGKEDELKGSEKWLSGLGPPEGLLEKST